MLGSVASATIRVPRGVTEILISEVSAISGGTSREIVRLRLIARGRRGVLGARAVESMRLIVGKLIYCTYRCRYGEKFLTRRHHPRAMDLEDGLARKGNIIGSISHLELGLGLS